AQRWRDLQRWPILLRAGPASRPRAPRHCRGATAMRDAPGARRGAVRRGGLPCRPMSFAAAFELALPLYLLILIGYLLARFAGWPPAVADALSRFVFVVAIPAMLFGLTSDLARLPPIDGRVLVAYFGACLAVFVLARVTGARAFGHDGVAQSVFAMASIYGNTVM